MFTIKFYNHEGGRQLILEADSFTILRDEAGDAEVTLHRQPGSNGEYRDVRYDVTGRGTIPEPGFPEIFSRAIIENANGRTTEIIAPMPSSRSVPNSMDRKVA